VRPVICTTGRSLVSESGRYLGRFIGCDKIITYEKLLMGNQINCSSVLMKKWLAERFCFPEGDFHEDYALWLDILSHGSFAVGINLPLLRYRVRRDSQSGHKLKSALMTYRVYRYSGLSIFESMYYMVHYAFNGIKKYFF
jgi:teichuronic acid biosynthesis glycosyltransferase TuaG